MKKGYIVDPAHCSGCRYSCFISSTTIYVCCSIYLDTGGMLVPKPEASGKCLNKVPGERTRIRPLLGFSKMEEHYGTA